MHYYMVGSCGTNPSCWTGMQFFLGLEQTDFKGLFSYGEFDKHMVFLSDYFVLILYSIGKVDVSKNHRVTNL